MGVAIQAQTNYFRVIGGIPHLPVMANTAAVSSPTSGMIIYSTTDGKPMIYSGSVWTDLCSASSFSSNVGYFKVVGGMPILPVKPASVNTTSGAMYLNSSASSTLQVYSSGSWQSVKSLRGTLSTTVGSAYNTELLAPVLSSDPTPTGLTAGAFYISSANNAISWYNGTAWVQSSCLCYAYSNTAHTTTLTFQCHNLGANTNLDPNTYVSNGDNVDYDIKGYLYQWGRPSDGHQLRGSGTTSTRSTTDVPGHANFITGSTNWRNPANNALWGATKTANDPCPAGYRVPTQAEWGSIFSGGTTSGASGTATNNTWTWTGNGYKVGSSLYLPAAGFRSISGTLSTIGSYGYYWSSTVYDGTYSDVPYFSSSTVYINNTSYIASGFSVRCVKDAPASPDCTVYSNTAHTTTLTFQCHNLGANTNLDPFTYVSNGDAVDYDIKGYLYQWGRPSDGHQLRGSGETATLSTTDTPGHAKFITNSGGTDWRSPANDALWGAAKTANDPCPAGYRVPTQAEWSSIYNGGTNTWTWTGYGYKVGTALYLPAAGYRNYLGGAPISVGTYGYYWSSTVAGTYAHSLLFLSGNVISSNTNSRVLGLSVRCVAETPSPDCTVYSNAAHTSTLTFQCHNLGANTNLDPLTYVSNGDAIDGDIKGHLYQWGRPSDGHEWRNSATIGTQSTTDIPGHAKFIIGFQDWRSTQNDALWGAAKTANDPCPAGYRVPTQAEWSSILSPNNTWVWTTSGYMVNSSLFLPAAGFRDATSGGTFGGIGSSGLYLSSTVNGAYANGLYFVSGSIVLRSDYFRANGRSVRCVANPPASPDCTVYSNAAHTSTLTFQCHNLGANTRLDPNTYVSDGDAVDYDIKGYLYQWGRPSDGHQLRSSVSTTTLATADNPGNAKFITNSASPFDWRSPQNDALWGAAKTANDPCPAGYRVPTQAEWGSIFSGGTTSGSYTSATSNTWAWTGNGYKINNALFLPAAGDRDRSSGSLTYTGSYGYYWSSTVNGTGAYYLYFNSSSVDPSYNLNSRAFGFSVRCVKEPVVSPDVIVYSNAAHTTTLTFQAHNLGANTNLDPLTYVSSGDNVDGDIKGYLYQWGRPTDGHQLRSSGETSTQSTTDAPGHAKIITGSSDWRNPANDALWGALKTPTDPCPAGYRVPTHAEWGSILSPNNTWTWTNSGYMVNSALFLPAAGFRYLTGGTSSYVGSIGSYWGSTVNGTKASELYFRSDIVSMIFNDRAPGFSVRCVKEPTVSPDVTVYSNAAKTTTLTFQAHNLGANINLDPLTYVSNGDNVDYDIKGYLYQWGRPTDGHQRRSSTAVSGTSSSDTPGNANFLYGSTDWRSPANDALWGATKTANDPCPTGYRVPTQAEWGSIFMGGTTSGPYTSATSNTWAWTGNGYKIGTTLFLPAAGYRDMTGGLGNIGSSGYYWSSTVTGTNVYYLSFSSSLVYPGYPDNREKGYSVRCVKEYLSQDVSVYNNAAKTTTLTFQAHNLGANTNLDPLTYVSNGDNVDSDIKGYTYQWGRPSDGHQLRGSATTGTQSTTDTPGNAKFITNTTSPYDWRSPQNDALWGATKTANDPCPTGYRVPTQAEWGSIFMGGTTSGSYTSATSNTWAWTGNGYKINNVLYLPAAGYRSDDGSTPSNTGSAGYYWSSTVLGTFAYALYFTSSTVAPGDNGRRARGFSVRCVKQ